MKDSKFSKALSMLHIVFYTSILWFITVFLTGTLLLLPAIGAVFGIGRDLIGKKLDITDSIIKLYFRYLRKSLRLICFLPVNAVMLLNVVGILAANHTGNTLYSMICLVLLAFLLVFVLYIAGYYTFINERVIIMEVFICQFIKPVFLLPVFIVSVLCVIFFSALLLTVLCFTGALFLFVLEAVILIQILYYKKMMGVREDEFYYLIDTSLKNKE